MAKGRTNRLAWEHIIITACTQYELACVMANSFSHTDARALCEYAGTQACHSHPDISVGEQPLQMSCLNRNVLRVSYAPA